ncbi:C40 family peptidase [Candidatus Woesearchaeota archaeon]|nr:C40 family peptidase [Candidatus Woesearchaeota archaeon]
MKYKKAFNPWPIFGVVFLLLMIFGGVFDVFGGSPLETPIGLKQYDILFANEQSEAVTNYVELSGEYSKNLAKDLLFKNSGIYEFQTTGKPQFKKCGIHLYPNYNSENDNCQPDFLESYTNYYRRTIVNYLSGYKDYSLAGNTYIDIITSKRDSNLQKDKIRIEGSVQNLNIPITSKATFDESKAVKYPVGLFGTYKDERTFVCSSGDCFSQGATYFEQFYKSSGTSMQYVKGGSSPYSYADSLLADIFYGVELQSVNEETGEFTKPGFDGAGFLWWLGKHTTVNFFETRKTTQEYFEDAKKGNIVCEGDSCTKENIIQNALPGDILFTYPEDGIPTHMMVYVGNDEIVHSSPQSGLVRETLSSSFFKNEETEINLVLRLEYSNSGLENLPGFEESSGGDCVVPVDFTQINNQLSGSRKSVSELIGSLNSHDSLKYVLEAHEKYPKVPAELILAIMNTEVNGGSAADLYLSGGGSPGKGNCNEVGMCTVMQIAPITCESINRQPNEYCSYEELKAGDTRQGIMTGAALLNSLMTDTRIVDPQNPNFYFVAMAYNSGGTTTKYIKEAASARLGRPPSTLQWSDITYEDVQTGASRLGGAFEKKAKHDEIFLYPNLVAKALQEQCSGSLMAGVSGSRVKSNSYFTINPKFITEDKINFEELDEINSFVNYVTEKCTDKLDVCIKNEISNFNSKHQIKITIDDEENAVGYDFIDQIYDCYENGQESCTCELKLNTQLKKPTKDFAIRLEKSGVVYVGDRDSYGLDSDTQKYLLSLPFNPVKFYIVETTEEKEDGTISVLSEIAFAPLKAIANLADAVFDFSDVEYLEITYDNQKNKTYFDIERPVKDKSMEVGVDFDSLAVVKGKNDMKWVPYKKGYGQLSCKDNKHNFRLQAHTTFSDETIDFSVYLNDTKAPELTYGKTSYSSCLEDIVPMLSWDVPIDDHFVDKFALEISTNKDSTNNYFDYEFYSIDAIEIEDPSKADTIGVLYKTTTNSKITYYARLRFYGGDFPFEPGMSYYYKITSFDAYENNKSFDWEGLPMPDMTAGSLVSKVIPESSYISGLVCKNFYQPKITLEELYGKAAKPEIAKFDDTDIELEVYPGIKHPTTGENLYRIANIPRVTCDEKNTRVGKICAGNKELVLKLHELSQLYLEPLNLEISITQAYRTYDIQQKLFVANGYDTSLACDPNPKGQKLCPHMVSGAIDIEMKDAVTKKGVNPLLMEDIMCSLGFVRYGNEDWHFEYGTNQFNIAESKRTETDRFCKYSGYDVLAKLRDTYRYDITNLEDTRALIEQDQELISAFNDAVRSSTSVNANSKIMLVDGDTSYVVSKYNVMGKYYKPAILVYQQIDLNQEGLVAQGVDQISSKYGYETFLV